MRSHSYQSLVARARRKRFSSTGILPVGPAASSRPKDLRQAIGLHSGEGNAARIDPSNEVFR